MGVSVFVTERFGPFVPTSVVAVAVLFVETGSETDEFTDVEFVITVPFAVPAVTLTTIWNVAVVDPAIFTSVQTTLPVPPTAGVAQLHPDGTVIETNVVFAGIAVTRTALSAAKTSRMSSAAGREFR